jgi:hypothetical protein
LWQALNVLFESASSDSNATLPTVYISFNTSVTSGMPGYTSPTPPSISSSVDYSIPTGGWPFNAKGFFPFNTQTYEAQQKLSYHTGHLTLSGLVPDDEDYDFDSTETSWRTELDLAALQGLFVLPSSNSSSTTTIINSTATSSNSSVTDLLPALTLERLTLMNLPPGPPISFPSGMATVMLWSFDMDRCVPGMLRVSCGLAMSLC